MAENQTGESLTEILTRMEQAAEKRHREMLEAFDKLPTEIAEAIVKAADSSDS